VKKRPVFRILNFPLVALMILLAFSSIFCIDQYSVIRGMTLISSALVMLYGGYLYKKPHGNLLKYTMLFLAFTMIFAAQRACTFGDAHFTEATTLLVACCTICYCAGRLHRFKQNSFLLGFAGANLIANYVLRVTNATDIRGPFQYIAAACYLIPFAALAFAYFYRYSEHKEAGLADRPDPRRETKAEETEGKAK